MLLGLYCLKAILRSFCGLDFAFKLKFMYVVLKSAFSSRCDDLCIFCVCVGFLKSCAKVKLYKNLAIRVFSFYPHRLYHARVLARVFGVDLASTGFSSLECMSAREAVKLPLAINANNTKFAPAYAKVA